ncbi:phosphatase PAP2 family protein [bacterium]|nr:phosphatase PAP2 family protein [bacterium]
MISASVCFICVSVVCLLSFFKSEAVNIIDGSILERIVQSRSCVPETLALLLSLPFNTGGMLTITSGVLIWSYLKRIRLLCFSCLFSVSGASLCSAALKLSISRPRPGLSFLPLVREDFFSMPSGHSTSAAALLMIIVICLFHFNLSLSAKIAYSSLIIIGILGVAWSRLYLAVHYPCDVLAGLLLGTAWACLGYGLAAALLKRLKEKAA